MTEAKMVLVTKQAKPCVKKTRVMLVSFINLLIPGKDVVPVMRFLQEKYKDPERLFHRLLNTSDVTLIRFDHLVTIADMLGVTTAWIAPLATEDLAKEDKKVFLQLMEGIRKAYQRSCSIHASDSKIMDEAVRVLTTIQSK